MLLGHKQTPIRTGVSLVLIMYSAVTTHGGSGNNPCIPSFVEGRGKPAALPPLFFEYDTSTWQAPDLTGHCEEKNLLFMQGIEPRFLGPPNHNLVSRPIDSP
jgi:hypothetical protein